MVKVTYFMGPGIGEYLFEMYEFDSWMQNNHYKLVNGLIAFPDNTQGSFLKMEVVPTGSQ